MTTAIRIRASAAPRISLCAASAVPPATQIEIGNEAADMGSMVHANLTARINNVAWDMATQAEIDGIDLEDAERACSFAWNAWCRVREYFPTPQTDHSFPPLTIGGVTFTGTADVISLSADGKTLYILDFKSGYGDGDHLAQLKTYGALGLAEFPEVETVYLCVLHIRHSEMETKKFASYELINWAADFGAATRTNRDVYSPSPEACGYCPRVHECPARQTMMAAASWLVVKPHVDDEFAKNLSQESGEDLAHIIERCRLLESACETVRDLVKASVIANGGEMEADEGRKLVITHGEKREIDFAAGEGVLQARLGDRWREAVKVVKGDAEKIVGELAPARGKGKAIKTMMDELESADAIRHVPTTRLEIRKTLALVAAE